jgi:hypothetical protein
MALFFLQNDQRFFLIVLSAMSLFTICEGGAYAAEPGYISVSASSNPFRVNVMRPETQCFKVFYVIKVLD